VRGLATLGIGSEQYSNILISIVMSKLPSKVKIRIGRETKDEVWKLDDLLGIIKNEERPVKELKLIIGNSLCNN